MTDFADNKKTLNEISIVRSKGLRNEIAGFITKIIKRELRIKEKDAQKQINIAESTEKNVSESVEKISK